MHPFHNYYRRSYGTSANSPCAVLCDLLRDAARAFHQQGAGKDERQRIEDVFRQSGFSRSEIR